jgi:hypothetical protein
MSQDFQTLNIFEDIQLLVHVQPAKFVHGIVEMEKCVSVIGDGIMSSFMMGLDSETPHKSQTILAHAKLYGGGTYKLTILYQSHNVQNLNVPVYCIYYLFNGAV